MSQNAVDRSDELRPHAEFVYAAELAAASSPVWVVHAEKGGDGGLTNAERVTLDSADNVTLVTVPGAVFLLPDEAPDQTAAVIATALSALH